MNSIFPRFSWLCGEGKEGERKNQEMGWGMGSIHSGVVEEGARTQTGG